MSSHHIVKEKQEPALVIDTLGAVSEEMLGQLLEWSPTVITNDSCAHILAARRINIDVIITEQTSFSDQKDVLLINMKENISFLDTAMIYLHQENYPSANILSLDTPFQLFTDYFRKINLVVWLGQTKTFAIKSGYTKWKTADEVVSLYEAAIGLHTIGLMEDGTLRYKTITDGFYSIYFEQDFALLTESY